MRSWPRGRITRLALGCLFSIAVALLTAEAILRVAALLAHDRSTGGWREDAKIRVLAVGDSHTFGTNVNEPEAYPAQLQAFLDQTHPGVYSILNLGVPGMSTTQVRNRLPAYVNRYRPDVVIVWCGVNNAWNQAEVGTGTAGWLNRLDGLSSRFRIYRFVRVWLHDRNLERAKSQHKLDGRHQIETTTPLDPNATFTSHQGNIIEKITHKGSEFRADAEMERRAREDYEKMIDWLRSAGVPSIFIAYPVDVGAFAVANSALRQVAKRHGVPLVEAKQSIERLPKEQVQFKWALHPNEHMYREIAKDVAERLESLIGD